MNPRPCPSSGQTRNGTAGSRSGLQFSHYRYSTAWAKKRTPAHAHFRVKLLTGRRVADQAFNFHSIGRERTGRVVFPCPVRFSEKSSIHYFENQISTGSTACNINKSLRSLVMRSTARRTGMLNHSPMSTEAGWIPSSTISQRNSRLK